MNDESPPSTGYVIELDSRRTVGAKPRLSVAREPTCFAHHFKLDRETRLVQCTKCDARMTVEHIHGKAERARVESPPESWRSRSPFLHAPRASTIMGRGGSPMNDRALPYHVRLNIADLEHVIHGGGPKELEADVVFTPTETITRRHDDAPGKLRVMVSKRHTHLEVQLLEVIPTPEQAAEAAAMRAEREANATRRPRPDYASWYELAPIHGATRTRDEMLLHVDRSTCVVLVSGDCPDDSMGTTERFQWLRGRMEQMPAETTFVFDAKRGALGCWVEIEPITGLDDATHAQHMRTLASDELRVVSHTVKKDPE